MIESSRNALAKLDHLARKIARLVLPEFLRSQLHRLCLAKAKMEIVVRLLHKNNRKTIYLFGCPIHPNMGDQAQTYCIMKWMQQNYPEYVILPFSYLTSFPFVLKLLRRQIGKHDLIFGHSGYFMVDHHKELPVYCKIAGLFPDYKIVILPQTINFHKKDVQERTAAAFNAHPNLTLLCRDQVSYRKAQTIFSQCKLLLYPDVVTTLIGSKTFPTEREGVLFCMRNDIEAYYRPDEIDALRERFKGIASTELGDTTITVSYRKIANNREQLLNDMLEKFARYKVIITDRYHGTIFSLIASTPVIVLSSADHKLNSGIKWFPDSYSRYVKFAKDLDEAFTLAMQMLDEDYGYQLPSYFQEEYYSNLKEQLQ